LQGYVIFVGKVREGTEKGLELSVAVNEAVDYCEKHQILQPFLTNHASEVVNMLTTEFKMEDAIAVWKEEGREEGEYRVLKLLESGYSLEEIKDILRRENEKSM